MLVVLTLLALSPLLLIDQILAILPLRSIPYGNESISLSGFSKSPWVYAFGVSMPGYGVGAVATEGKSLVSVFTQFFNSGVWLILCLAIIIMISLVSSILSNSVSDAVKASVFSITIVSVLGIYYLNMDLKPALYSLPLRSSVIEDAVATLSLMIIAGTIVNIIALAALSGLLTYVALALKPSPAPTKPVKPEALETPVATSPGEAGKRRFPPLSTPPLCPNCGSKLVWRPEESRYFCEKCQSYPEDIYLNI